MEEIKRCRLVRDNVAFNVAVWYGIVKLMGDEVTFYFETVEERQDESTNRCRSFDF